jgi:hypothetical protein
MCMDNTVDQFRHIFLTMATDSLFLTMESDYLLQTMETSFPDDGEIIFY